MSLLTVLEVVLLLFFASLYLYASLSARKSGEEDKFEIALGKLAKLWTEDETHGVEVEPPVASRTLPSFNAKELNEFYRNHLAPYVETALYSATIGPALDVIIKVLVILDTDGDCPSVADVAGDPEKDAYGSSYGILRKVTLREHSIHVAEESVRIISGRYREPELLLGRVLIVALAHDLGKIPRFRSGPAYVLGNHPAISAAVLEPLLVDLPGKEEVLKAVRDHHSAASSDPLIRILHEADRRAREREIGMLAGASALVPRGSFSWLSASDLISAIEREVNVVSEEGTFRAFTTSSGVCYVQPALIGEVVARLARERNVVLETLDYRALSTAVVHDHLKGFLAAPVGEGYSGRKCKVRFKDGKERVYVFTPLMAEAFKTPLSELEGRKSGKLLEVERVEIMPFEDK